MAVLGGRPKGVNANLLDFEFPLSAVRPLGFVNLRRGRQSLAYSVLESFEWNDQLHVPRILQNFRVAIVA